MPTIPEVLADCQLADVLAAREELEVTGRLTATGDEPLRLADAQGHPITANEALAEIDAWLSARIDSED